MNDYNTENMVPFMNLWNRPGDWELSVCSLDLKERKRKKEKTEVSGGNKGS